MKAKEVASVAFALALTSDAAAMAHAPTLSDFVERAEAFYQSMDGMEVQVSGWIGRNYHPDDIYFLADGGEMYHTWRSDWRSRRRELHDCKLPKIGEPQGSGKCRASGMSVIRVNDKWHDSLAMGYRIYLEIRNLEITRAE